MRGTSRFAISGAVVALVYGEASADGVDTVAYFTRVGAGRSMPALVGGLFLLMLANYALNLVVIGLPAVKVGPASFRNVAVGLIGLTVLGQVADRAGALVAGLGAGPLAAALGLEGEGGWVVPLLALNFFFSGLAVGALSRYFLRRRWQVSSGAAWAIAIAAAVLTNPAWALGLWFT